VASEGRLGSSDGLTSPESSPPVSDCGGFGSDEGPEDAHAAEITSAERVRTRTPSFFFMATPLRNRTPAYPRFVEEYTAAPAWIEAAPLLQESFRFAPRETDTYRVSRPGNAVLKARLKPETDEIHSSPAGEFLTEAGRPRFSTRGGLQ
jgi:hypothetical protein